MFRVNENHLINLDLVQEASFDPNMRCLTLYMHGGGHDILIYHEEAERVWGELRERAAVKAAVA